MSAELIIVLVLTLYFGVLIALTWWSRSDTKSVEGYFIANKNLPYWVVAFSTNATGESAWLLLGLTGMGYAVGVHALWVMAGEVLGAVLAWTLVARRLKRAADAHASITVADFFSSHFGDRHIIRLLTAFIILSMVFAYIAAQMIATGKAFGTFLSMSYSAGVLLGGGIALAYTAFGGFKAVAYSDVVQGVLMLVALVTLPLVGLAYVDGDLFEQLGAIDPNLINLAGTHGWTWAGIIAIASFLAIGLPFMGVPQLLTRFMSIRDEREIPKAAGISIAVIALFDLGAVFAGMTGRVLFPELADQELILPTMSKELLPPIVTGLFMVAVLAAIMSTVDSLLILASSAVVRDVLQQTLRTDISNARLASIAQGVTVAIGLGAMAWAFTEAKVIFDFVLFAWSGLGAAFGPPLLCALFWRRTTRWGAILGIATGFVVNLIWIEFFKAGFYELYELIPAFAAGLTVTLLASLLTRAPVAHIDAAKR